MLFGQDSEEDIDPLVSLSHLKMLYDMHKCELTDKDQATIITSIYLKEQATYRYYRERLFEKIA